MGPLQALRSAALEAVHSGADLESAISNCMGYRSEGQGFMVGVQINRISGLPSGFPELLQFVLEHVEDKNVEALLEGLLEAREELRPVLLKSNDRLKDLLFLDIALDSTVRTAVERGYEELNNAKPEKVMFFITLLLENLALSSDDNEDLIYCLKGWNQALSMIKNGDSHWALYAKSVLDRTRLALTSKAEWYQHLLQPSAEYLGSHRALKTMKSLSDLNEVTVFVYDRNQMNVLEVNKTDYENCIYDHPLHNWTTGAGRDVVPLNVTRKYYFISGKGFRYGGMKFVNFFSSLFYLNISM